MLYLDTNPSTNKTSTTTTTAATPSTSKKNHCETCQQTFAKWSELVQHRRTEHRSRCELCDRTFSTPSNLRAHLGSVHRCDKNAVSATFAAKTPENDAANENTKTATLFACTDCDRRFAHERNLRAHWRQHHDDEAAQRFVCERCSTRLSSKRKLTQHMEWHAKHPDYEVRQPHNKESQWLCEVAGCGRRYVRRQALVEHVRKAHPGEPLPRPAVVKEMAAQLAGLVNGVDRLNEMETESDDVYAETFGEKTEKMNKICSEAVTVEMDAKTISNAENNDMEDQCDNADAEVVGVNVENVAIIKEKNEKVGFANDHTDVIVMEMEEIDEAVSNT